MPRRVYLFAALLFFWATAAPAQVTTNVSFQNATDINPFVVNHDGVAVPTSGAGSNFNFGAAVGVGGGGGLVTTNVDANANYVGPSYTGSAASAATYDLTRGVTASIFFRGPETPGDRPIQIGFLNQVNSSFNNDNVANTIGVAFVSVRPFTNGELQQQVKSVNGGTVNTDFRPGGGTNLTPNEWYKLTFSTRETAPGAFASFVVFDDYGTTGTAFVSNVFTSATPLISSVTGFEVANGGLLGADGLGIAGFRVVIDTPNLNNFSVTGFSPVPEPASLALCGTCAGVLAWRRRRSWRHV